MVDNTSDFLDSLKDESTAGFQAVIDYERQALDMESFVDLDIDQAWSKFSGQRPYDQLFISIVLSENEAP